MISEKIMVSGSNYPSWHPAWFFYFLAPASSGHGSVKFGSKTNYVQLCVFSHKIYTSFYSLHIFKDSPIKHVVIVKPLACEEITEYLAQVGILGFFVKFEGTEVVEIGRKFSW